VTLYSRSLAPISADDLAYLARVAHLDRIAFFSRNPRYRVLADRVVAVALCQGAALHFLDGRNGIKDFDVWTFSAAHPDATYPPRRMSSRLFGDHDTRSSPDHPEFVGRRVHLLGRSLRADVNADPVKVLRQYLSERRTNSARHLAEKAVILIEPEDRLGIRVWPE